MFVLCVGHVCCSVICSLDNLLANINVYFFFCFREQPVCGMTPDLGNAQNMGKTMNPMSSLNTAGSSGAPQGQDATVSNNTSTFPSPGGQKEPGAIGPVQGHRFGCPGTMSHSATMQAATPQGSGYPLKLSSPSQGSPGMLSTTPQSQSRNGRISTLAPTAVLPSR